MKLGIIGLPNVGKKHPFQRHNKSRCRGGQLSVLHHRAKRGRGVTVPDERLKVLHEMYNSKKDHIYHH